MLPIRDRRFNFFFLFMFVLFLLRPVIVRRLARYPRKAILDLFHGLKLLTFYSQNKLSDVFVVYQPNLRNTTTNIMDRKRIPCHKSTPLRIYYVLNYCTFRCPFSFLKVKPYPEAMDI